MMTPSSGWRCESLNQVVLICGPGFPAWELCLWRSSCYRDDLKSQLQSLKQQSHEPVMRTWALLPPGTVPTSPVSHYLCEPCGFLRCSWGSSTLGQVDSEGDDAFYFRWGAHESIRRPHRGWWKVPAWTLFLLSSLSLPDLHPWGPIHYWGGSWVFHFSMSWTNPFLVYFFEFWVML